MTTAKVKVESGVQLLARLSKKTEIKNFYPILFEKGLKHGDSVEIYSDARTSYLIVDLICEALFPCTPNENPTGVLMFNTAGIFNYEVLIMTLQKKINSKFNIGGEESDQLLHKTLSNFFLLEIYDATQFYTSIHNLDNILMKHTSISLLIFDTLTAFYWSEQGFIITKMDMYVKNLLRIIQKVSKEYKVILAYTRPGYFSSSKDTDNIDTSGITDSINFKVQVVENSNGFYEVNVKTSDSFYKKCLSITDNVIKWQ